MNPNLPVAKILAYPRDVEALRTVCRPVLVNDIGEMALVRDLVMRMKEMMYDRGGIGISAVQIGEAQRVFVVHVPTETKLPLVFVNPKIISRAFSYVTLNEGCLSFPGSDKQPEAIMRPEKVTIYRRDELGREDTYTFDRYTARAIYHEMDHLDGKLLIDHLSRARRRCLDQWITQNLREEERKAIKAQNRGIRRATFRARQSISQLASKSVATTAAQCPQASVRNLPMNVVVALNRTELARVAPNYEAMRTAIEVCERVDEIANLADHAVAAQAYFRQTQDVDNETQASRIRVRAERKLGSILKRMAETGARRKQNDNQHGASSAVRLADLGIPKDRASRAMQLAQVPQDQFDAALTDDRVAQPRRILREAKESSTAQSLVPIDKTLKLWSKVRDFGTEIESGELPDVAHWRENLQPFQLEHLERYVPQIIGYLTHIRDWFWRLQNHAA